METIGKYHIVRVLGHGGMGTVYEAVDPLIRRKVALKTMIPEMAETAELRARFLREAQAAGGLQHRNIVTVYDLGEEKGRPYIAMEFIEGTDLEKIIQNRDPYPIEWKLDVLAQVCEGLSHAHRNGIVHRDVKPGNVRVTAQGDVKIMDFGVAHLQSSNLTKSGGMLGTVHYMSPEQLNGRKVDHRADVFSVGAIAYELLSLRRPFDGDSITGVMFKIMHEDADPGLIPSSDYSPGLERIVMKAMARNVEERYQSLDEMHDELAGLVRETAARLGAGGETSSPEQPAAEVVDVRGQAARLVALGKQAMAEGHFERARECAQQALALVPDEAEARALSLDAEAESLRRRVEQEMADIRAEMEEARDAGQLQRALGLCRKLLDLDPDDATMRQTESEIQRIIQEKEVEQLSSQALSYAADGDLELAQKIAARVERIAPQSPTFLKLRLYLDEEGRFRRAEALTSLAQEHLAQGELDEARAAAEKALLEDADHAVAREIRDRAAEVLDRRAGTARKAEAPEQDAHPAPVVKSKARGDTEPMPVFVVPAEAEPEPVLPPAPEPEPVPPPVLAPEVPEVPVAAAAPPVAARAAAPAKAPPAKAPPTKAPSPFRAPPPVKAPPLVKAQTPAAPVPAVAAPPPAPAPAPAEIKAANPAPPPPAAPPVNAAPVPVPAVASAPAPAVETGRHTKGEAEALMSLALDHFVQNNHGKARKAVEKALALEPENKKARELMKILGALG